MSKRGKNQSSCSASTPEDDDDVLRGKLNDELKRERTQQYAIVEKMLPEISEDEYEEESSAASDADNEIDPDNDVDGDASMAEDDDSEDGDKKEMKQAWRPGVNSLKPDEELDYDPRVYHMYHRAMFEWSCFSFDILPDALGLNRTEYPHTLYLVAGTQADTSERNRLYITKWKNLTPSRRALKATKTLPNGDMDLDTDSDVSDDDEDNEDNMPVLDFRSFEHPGTVNRVRVCPQLPRLAATWSDNGTVYMWDIKQQQDALESPGSTSDMKKDPKFAFSGHKEEGYAMDFHPTLTGVFASGSRDHTFRVWRPVQSGWQVGEAITAHTDSVEDLKWKPLGSGDQQVLATCSIDGSIKLFDMRVAPKAEAQLDIVKAHASDVNAIAWSPFQEDFLLSGGDDGCSRVWDMRNASEPIVHLQWHREPILSVSWHPTDSATFAVASLDNSITFWDMSVEASNLTTASSEARPEQPEFPDQLMFQHMGQTHISEIRWHPQIPGVMISTAEDGFNVFKTFNMA